MIDPHEHLECIARTHAEITAALDRGEVPAMCDARVLAWNSQVLAEEIRRLNIAALRERTAEADKASQVATLNGEPL